MKHETELLLECLRGLLAQADREPEKAEDIVSMVAATIARARRRTCLACHRKMKKGHKFKRVDGGVTHLHCDFPDSYLTADEYQARYGHPAPSWWMKGAA